MPGNNADDSVIFVRTLSDLRVRKVGDRLRISAQLVDDSGAQRWSAAFDRRLEDVFGEALGSPRVDGGDLVLQMEIEGAEY